MQKVAALLPLSSSLPALPPPIPALRLCLRRAPVMEASFAAGLRPARPAPEPAAASAAAAVPPAVGKSIRPSGLVTYSVVGGLVQRGCKGEAPHRTAKCGRGIARGLPGVQSAGRDFQNVTCMVRSAVRPHTTFTSEVM